MNCTWTSHPLKLTKLPCTPFQIPRSSPHPIPSETNSIHPRRQRVQVANRNMEARVITSDVQPKEPRKEIDSREQNFQNSHSIQSVCGRKQAQDQTQVIQPNPCHNTTRYPRERTP
ncbi:hypothetical protein T440DRAFT_322599 [Plenodomus tracheiphilus IPT5]|uniref:Uncharacterized protein n=1 Tax=Plenodomus tracheiphilus IPT5 TaxID=1408161 RepID=A0A6A7BD39_9PLEO|nr:hypothetical protein T440DRAFT_322599 [Plenodomus tracheiphilus IPT5]